MIHRLIVVLLLVSSTFSFGASQFENSAWHPLEVRLHASGKVNNAYRDVPVAAVWEDGNGQRHESIAFSDDGLLYRLRTALPEGTWRWRVVSAPDSSGLLGQTGDCEIRKKPEGNPIYRHGWLSVRKGSRVLEHHDGTPFFWLGDTAWNAPWLAGEEDWDYYLLRRAQQGFSVILLHCTNSKNITELETPGGLRPFSTEGTPIPEYWDRFERIVLQANRRGLLALVVGVGLSSSKEYQAESSSPEFARYLAARLGGLAVVFSPSMDIPHRPANDVMARELKRVSPRHLVTQHVGTDLPAALEYAVQDYIDLVGLQSGHANDDLAATRRNVIEWVPEVRSRARGRPTSNLEAMYQEFGDATSRSRRRIDARHLAYLSLLSGSYGTTYGASGIWKWTAPGETDSWREALEWESGEDMTRLRALFGEFEWWSLEPRPECVLGNHSVPEARQALACNPEGTLAVAWLPNGGRIRLAASIVPQAPHVTWFDPLTARRVPGIATKAVDENGTASFVFESPSDLSEAVLILRSQKNVRLDQKEIVPGHDSELRTPRRNPAAKPEDLTIDGDGFYGDEATTEPKWDRNDGRAGDNPRFRRHNVGRAHSGKGFSYWYTSKYQQPGEPSPSGEQWVDYVPDVPEGPARSYRLTLRTRNSDARAHYPLRCLIYGASGIELFEIPQRQAGDAIVDVLLGEFVLKKGSFIRLRDEGGGSVLFGSLVCSELPPLRPGWGGIFDITHFGATPDDHSIDSDSINRAIEAAFKRGGGTVTIPPGRFLSGTIRLKSNITLYLEAGAVLEAAHHTVAHYDPPEPNEWGERHKYQDFGHSHWQNSLIWGVGLSNVSILGPGLIYGLGLDAGVNPHADKSKGEKRYYENPKGCGNKAIALKDCTNVTLRDFSILRGGWFGILATGVNNMTLDNLKIDSNRDGIDIDACQNVRVSRCSINTPWDDGICLKASYGLGEIRHCDNITISDCYLAGDFVEGTLLDGTFQRSQPRHNAFRFGRIKLGTESNGDFKNIAITNCVFDGSKGIAIESVDGARIEDIAISNITMRRVVDTPLFIRLGSRLRGPEGTKVGTIQRISVNNLVASDVNWRLGILVSGIPGHPVSDVRLSNIRVAYQGGGPHELGERDPPEEERAYPEPTMFGDMPSYAFFFRHAQGVTLSDTKVTYDAGEARPAVVLDEVTEAWFSHFDAEKPAGGAPVFDLRRVSGFRVHDSPVVDDKVFDALSDRIKF
ncbi:MAG: DUF4038 domain-containing protein [Opitutaceae bacterium]|nr:DUF4038 domain-containing protein [Opitutaceae bacterium]